MMPNKVEIVESLAFKKDLKRLSKKYRRAPQDLEALITRLRVGETPGDRIPGVDYVVYKERLPNTSANRGEQGGFRVIYYVQLEDRVILLTMYSKTEQADMPTEVIRRIVIEYLGTSDADE